jgi:hypothetical protein
MNGLLKILKSREGLGWLFSGLLAIVVVLLIARRLFGM